MNHLNLVFEKLPKETKCNIRLPDAMRDALTYAANHLKGANRRMFIAETVCSIGDGGQRMAEKMLGWNRGTIRKGMHELHSGIYCVDNFSGRGRTLSEEHLPSLLKDITAIVTLIKHIEPEDRGFFEIGGAIGDLSG
jgi:DNA-binding protein Fis